MLRGFLGGLGGGPSFLRCLQIRRSLGKLHLLCALVHEPRLLLLGLTRLFGRSNALLLRIDFGELKLCETCVVTIRILDDEEVQCILVANLQRELVVAPYFGSQRWRWDGFLRGLLGWFRWLVGSLAVSLAGTSGTSSPPSVP